MEIVGPGFTIEFYDVDYMTNDERVLMDSKMELLDSVECAEDRSSTGREGDLSFVQITLTNRAEFAFESRTRTTDMYVEPGDDDYGHLQSACVGADGGSETGTILQPGEAPRAYIRLLFRVVDASR